MSPGEFLKRPNLTYCQSGALMVFLRERGWLRDFYDAYKATFDADPTGRIALEKTSGMPLEEMEDAWVKWLTDRPATPFFGAPALFLGARLAPGEGGLTVIALAPNGPLADAGVEPRDVILSLDGRPLPDYASLRPALGSYAPGKTITLRVRRAGSERDVKVTLAHLGGAPRRLAPRR
jgi:predicted metalloprotease with PDZ domain